MIKYFTNENKYLSTDLIQACFEPGRVNWVDKVVTGNGFSHGFSLIRPKFGKVNILIAPNQSVVKDKEEEYKRGKFGFEDCKAAFVYEGQGLKGYTKDFDLIVIVSDSFVNFAWKVQDCADKIMIDECHSAIIQSSFRYKLKQLFSVIHNNFEDAAISFVTASPTLFQNVTIKIINKQIEPRKLHVSNNQEFSIRRCVQSIQEGKRTLIFCHEASVIKKILKEANRKDFNLIAGSSFTTTLLTKDKYEINQHSNILIGSSASFEGWSDFTLNGNCFIYMNIANRHSTFLGCNIYQSIGRLRTGFNYAEACITNLAGGGYSNKSISNLREKVQKFINIEDSPEHKQKRGFTFYYKGDEVKAVDLFEFVYFKRNEEKYIIEPFEPAFLIHDEIQQIDTRLNIYKDFFEERKIELIQIDNDITKKRLVSKIKRNKKIENIICNVKKNNLQDLIPDFFFKSKPQKDFLNYYINELTGFIAVSEEVGVELEDKYYNLLNFFTVGGYSDELKELYIEAKKEKGEGIHKIRENLKDWDERIFVYCLEVAFGIVFGRFESYFVGHRDYNKLTLINLRLIRFITEKLGLKVIEIDIKNAFPRIVYALNGLDLPNNFYDVPDVPRHIQKRKVNITLNSFRYDPKNNRPKSTIKAESKRRLKQCGFIPEVIEWLINNFFEAQFKGDFFNFVSYHEKIIIKQLIEVIKSYNLTANYSIFRRHDSVIIFTNDTLNFDNLHELVYLDVPNWVKPIEKDSKIDDVDDDFLLADLLW